MRSHYSRPRLQWHRVQICSMCRKSLLLFILVSLTPLPSSRLPLSGAVVRVPRVLRGLWERSKTG